MNEKTRNVKNLTGFFIYHDEKHTIYYDVFTKNGYILSNSDLQKYTFYSAKILIALLAGYIISIICSNVYISIAIGILVFVVLEILFRKRFLSTLPSIPNYKINKDNKTKTKPGSSLSNSRLILSPILSLVLAIMIVINARSNSYTGLLLYLNYLLAIAALGFSLYFLYMLIININRFKANK